jgi:osmoprotectant transport system ATP-binding protein
MAEQKNSLRNALSMMLMCNLMTLCVVDDKGDFLGTITYNDIQKAIKESYTDEAERNGGGGDV